ncbi:MAG: class I SAM-dependent methyltransferase [Jatrophihabitantaceae bacterium]
MGSPAASGVKHLPINPALGDYLLRSSSPPDEVIASLVDRTAELGGAAGMMVPVEQAGLLSLLSRLLKVECAVDIGTFTGLSALAIARGLAPGGRVISCDVTDQWSEIAREHWTRAGLADRIDFRLGPAGRTLGELAPESVDLVFIDADKMNYPNYYRSAVPLLRSGGLLLLDNVLLDGYVLDPELAHDGLMRRCASTLRLVNAEVAADERLEAVMLPIADGLTIARKR